MKNIGQIILIGFLSILPFSTNAAPVELTDAQRLQMYEYGVKMNTLNQAPPALNSLTGVATDAVDYNVIQDDVRDVLKSSSTKFKDDITALRASVSETGINASVASGLTSGAKSLNMANAYKSFIGNTCDGFLNMESYFTGTGTTCISPDVCGSAFCAKCDQGLSHPECATNCACFVYNSNW